MSVLFKSNYINFDKIKNYYLIFWQNFSAVHFVYWKVYTADKNFTRPPVAPVAPNINSDLRHWLHCWQLRTTIWTITLCPLNREWWWQHSQFLRCFVSKLFTAFKLDLKFEMLLKYLNAFRISDAWYWVWFAFVFNLVDKMNWNSWQLLISIAVSLGFLSPCYVGSNFHFLKLISKFDLKSCTFDKWHASVDVKVLVIKHSPKQTFLSSAEYNLW